MVFAFVRTHDPVWKYYRLGGSSVWSSAGPGRPESQWQQCQSQRLPRGPGAFHSPAHSPGTSPSGELTQANKKQTIL